MRIDDTQHAARQRLYDLGMTDRQIGQKLGVTHVAIRAWRRVRGLAGNGRSGGQALPRRQHEERMRFYRLGWSDSRIGRACGCSRFAVWKWRRDHGLVAANESGGPRHQFRLPDEDRRMSLYRRGMTDKAIAEAVCCTPKAISAWRYKRSLEVNKANGWRPSAATLVSLDADLGEGGFNRHALVADDAAAAWLESVGATVW